MFDDIDSTLNETLQNIEARETDGGGDGTPAPSPAPTVSSPQEGDAGKAAAPATSTPVPAAAAAEGVTQAEWDAMPKSWKKDYEPKWKSVDPDVRKYIHQREKEQLDGITQYKEVADRWGNTLKPFEQAFKHFGMDPHEAFTNLANAHMTLKYGSPEARAAVARSIIQDYGLGQYIQGPGGRPLAAPVDPQLQARLDRLETETRQRTYQEKLGEVDKFFSNPENKFAADVAEDMMQLMKSGAATDLKSAYDLAIYRNPSVRQKIVQEEAERLATAPKPGPRNVKSGPIEPAPTGQPKGSIDDTLKETYAAIMNRG